MSDNNLREDYYHFLTIVRVHKLVLRARLETLDIIDLLVTNAKLMTNVLSNVTSLDIVGNHGLTLLEFSCASCTKLYDLKILLTELVQARLRFRWPDCLIPYGA